MNTIKTLQNFTKKLDTRCHFSGAEMIGYGYSSLLIITHGIRMLLGKELLELSNESKEKQKRIEKRRNRNKRKIYH